jgi:tetratricopeptide (TPR) repeat protein
MTKRADKERVFSAALELDDPAQRNAFLDAACGADRELRAQVEALLQHDGEAGSFIERPAVPPPGTVDYQPVTEVPGTVIGPYKLLQKIGEGGFGVVYMAEQQQPVRRKVALKIIKPGMDTRQVIARFEAERQALAVMDHPNIAHVLDAGSTESGRPYFVMELVRGTPITEYCDENQLPIPERLELFATVCQAIQHAHTKGIIHRDIKPTNVLVTRQDGQPVVKVIDFGVAKAMGQQLTEKTLFTEFAQMIGTPLYMSPEQAELSSVDIDTRSDIYSLGVLLYELLTGTTPVTREQLKQAAFDEIRRIIREEDPPKPSTRISTAEAAPSIAAQRHTEPAKLAKLVRGELDWIVMKALEKERNRRYETANGFAKDIEHYLNDEPVLACPPSAGYRFRKFARRNRSALAVAALVLFFLVLLGSGVGWTWRDRAARAAERANHLERAVERAELLQQEGKRGEALAALEQAQLLAREAEPAPHMAERIESLQQQLDAAGRDEVFVAQFEAIRREVQTEVDLEKSTFRQDGAYPNIREALEQYGLARGVTPPADAVVHIQKRPAAIQAVVVAALDECLYWAPRTDSDDREWLIDVLQKADYDPWRNKVRRAWKQPATLEALAKDIDVRQQPPNFLLQVAKALPTGSPGRLDLARRVQFAYPGDFWANHELGWELAHAGKRAEAIRYYTAALSLRPDNPGVLINRSNTLRHAGELEAAVTDLQRAVTVSPRYVAAHINLGAALGDQKKLPEAVAAYRKAIEIDPKCASAYTHLGDGLGAQKRLDEAVAAYRQAIEIDPRNAKAYNGLGVTLCDQKKFDEAVVAFRLAIEIDPKYAKACNNLGNALAEQNKLDEAVVAYRKAIEVAPKDATAYANLGRALQAQRKLEEAIAAFRKAIEIDPKCASAHDGLGGLLCDDLREYGKAIECIRKAIELDPNNAAYHSNLGTALSNQWQTGAAAEAQQTLDEAIAAKRKALVLDPKDAKSRRDLGVVLGHKGWDLVNRPDPKARDPKRALETVQEAIELDRQSAVAWQHLGWVRYRIGDWRASIEALEKSCQLENGGDCGQWIVLALAHARLAGQEGLPAKEREEHQSQARRWYDQAVKQIDAQPHRPGDVTGRAIWDIREEARELLATVESKK